ncbi:hypothetical protein PIB30_055288 [Stylosanthes scabra]|uniref:Secreted peptide n=1 Tax=Stylosanthes scabra TaxID=79078 RepID=A0ABU6WIN4_9FABA|nr:hypothetical protein [Stylosanthes scabra]
MLVFPFGLGLWPLAPIPVVRILFLFTATLPTATQDRNAASSFASLFTAAAALSSLSSSIFSRLLLSSIPLSAAAAAVLSTHPLSCVSQLSSSVCIALKE